MKQRAVIIFALLLAVTTMAHAAVYTVVLNNGTSLETRYEPVDAEWSDGVTMIMTDQGNWIALDKVDIADVSSSVEISGFGRQLDTTTILLGYTHNEGEISSELQAGAGGPGGEGFGGQLPSDQGLPRAEDAPFTLDQFVGASEAGSQGGVPLEFTAY